MTREPADRGHEPPESSIIVKKTLLRQKCLKSVFDDYSEYISPWVINRGILPLEANLLLGLYEYLLFYVWVHYNL